MYDSHADGYILVQTCASDKDVYISTEYKIVFSHSAEHFRVSKSDYYLFSLLEIFISFQISSP